jgi:hypothetical protein
VLVDGVVATWSIDEFGLNIMGLNLGPQIQPIMIAVQTDSNGECSGTCVIEHLLHISLACCTLLRAAVPLH